MRKHVLAVIKSVIETERHSLKFPNRSESLTSLAKDRCTISRLRAQTWGIIHLIATSNLKTQHNFQIVEKVTFSDFNQSNRIETSELAKNPNRFRSNRWHLWIQVVWQPAKSVVTCADAASFIDSRPFSCLNCLTYTKPHCQLYDSCTLLWQIFVWRTGSYIVAHKNGKDLSRYSDLGEQDWWRGLRDGNLELFNLEYSWEGSPWHLTQMRTWRNYLIYCLIRNSGLSPHEKKRDCKNCGQLGI